MAIKKEIAPKGLSFGVSDFTISDKFATILSVLSYPKYITPGYLSSLTAGQAGVKIVIKHIPVAFDVVSKMLNKQLIDLYYFLIHHRCYQNKSIVHCCIYSL